MVIVTVIMALVKTSDEIRRISSAGLILKEALHKAKDAARVGVTLIELDTIAREYIESHGGKPSFLGYRPHGAKRPYPATLCTSLNEVVVHGVPTKYALKDGDILKIDLGVVFQGYHADAAFTIGIGEIAKKEKELIHVTEEALRRGIQSARAGNRLGDIGYAIQSYVESHGFAVVQGLTGHGVGEELHEDPSVYNEGQPGKGMLLKPGMVLAIEPMVSMGSPVVRQIKDESYATKDGAKAAHFEHTIVVNEGEATILT